VYPAALQFLDSGSACFFSIVWFLTLFLLGIDTLFALDEGITTIILDMPRFKSCCKEVITLMMCITGFLCSMVYVSDIGVYLFDIVDHTAINYTLIIVAALEALMVGWLWAWPEMQSRTGTACAPPPPASNAGSVMLGTAA
jgi:SNF family Na+-dependent transporter